MIQTINLESYNVQIGEIRKTLDSFLSNVSYTRIIVLVDSNTRVHCLPLISSIVPDPLIVTIDAGEQFKELKTCEYIWSQLVSSKCDRHALMINIGGGVIGDMGGFVASCYLRGIDFIQIPTTLLSQVDASVGGKLGVDFQGYKNFIGLFRDPLTVLIDPTFLNTLPTRELRSGYAEMIKHALIKDKNIWKRLTKMDQWQHMNWHDEIFHSVHIKKNVVLEDPNEKGLRKILNFGHTIGHAIESIALQSEDPLFHGEAIAIGMIAEAVLSNKLSSLSQKDLHEIVTYINSTYSELKNSYLLMTDDILNLMKSDKKNRGGKILISLLRSIGDCSYDFGVSEEDIKSCLIETHSLLNPL